MNRDSCEIARWAAIGAMYLGFFGAIAVELLVGVLVMLFVASMLGVFGPAFQIIAVVLAWFLCGLGVVYLGVFWVDRLCRFSFIYGREVAEKEREHEESARRLYRALYSNRTVSLTNQGGGAKNA